MKAIKLSVAIIMLGLFSCSKNDDKPQTVPELNLSTDQIGFSETDSVQSITIQSNTNDYSASVPAADTWCTFQKDGMSIKISAAKLPSTSAERTTKISFTAGSGNNQAKKTLTVTQKRVWKLLWEENFNVDGPVNPLKWTLVEKGNPDWCKYMSPTNDMAFVQNGNLILKGIKTAEGYKTSGVQSQNKFSFKYGKVEVRAKLSVGKGTWPAIWMMPQESVFGGWPKSGEIDIMEHLNNDNNIYQVVHSHYVDNLGNKTNPNYVATPQYLVGEFNTFGIEWFPHKIDFLINGKVTFTYPKVASIPADQLQWPFDQSFYIILNLAMGGSWGGPVDDNILPVQTEIDYVKVYGLSNY